MDDAATAFPQTLEIGLALERSDQLKLQVLLGYARGDKAASLDPSSLFSVGGGHEDRGASNESPSSTLQKVK